MKPVFFFDVETGGLEPARHRILSLAWCLEIDGSVVDTGSCLIKPDDGDISIKALEINSLRIHDIMENGISEMEAVKRLVKVFNTNGMKENKFFPCAYNASFDMSFIIPLFYRVGSNFFWYSKTCILDPLPMMRFMEYTGAIKLENYKLATVTSYLNIVHTAHSAMSDMMALRAAFHFIKEKYHEALYSGTYENCHPSLPAFDIPVNGDRVNGMRVDEVDAVKHE